MIEIVDRATKFIEKQSLSIIIFSVNRLNVPTE